jgi:4-hydroxyacetophenone monooxygenase
MSRRSRELAEASDADIAAALQHANPMVLRGLLHQLSGDESLRSALPTPIAGAYRPPTPTLTDPKVLAELQAKAAAFLRTWRDSGAEDLGFGPRSRLPSSMALAVGAQIPEADLEMWIETLALDPMARGLAWRTAPDAARREAFRVLVIGAGMSGLYAAVQLERAGIPFVVVEKNAGVGGTWNENRYPGARVDSPSRIYFNTLGVGFELPNAFCPQAVNQRYYDWVADHFGVRERIVFETEVRSLGWDEAAGVWEVHAEGPSGEQRFRANAVMTGVGFLNRPNQPLLEGAERFRGLQFHTSRWPEDLDLAGKRVAVIGSGATAYQMTPVLAKRAAHLDLYQRTPRWCLETPGYLTPFPEQVTWLDRNFPYLVNFNRFVTAWRTRPETLRAVTDVDPAHRVKGSSSAGNKAMRDMCEAFIARVLSGRPDLQAKMTPELPPFTSRPVLVDAEDNIYAALLRDDVSLVSDPIARITERGIQTADGAEHLCDVIVYATGFRANDYLYPMEIRGRGGRRLDDLWAKDGARAYLGTLLPGFPNLFTLYGPNMNPFGAGLSVTDLQEIQTRFALKCFEHLILEGRRSVDVTLEAYERFNAEQDRRHAKKVFADPRITNYYRNEFGRCSVNSGFDVPRLWRWLRDPSVAIDEGSDAIVRPWFGADLIVD